jgi:16S rRNA (cytidine1402-2'-O)-methyltransferase
MAGTLILCATPIGNLGDVSSRLVETLRSADIVYAEDTRRTGRLLNHLGISVPMRSFFEGNERTRLDQLAAELTSGSVIALVSDAGMPVISDPGATAVRVAIDSGATVTAIPGPSAVTMAVAVSGFDGDRFVFGGFLPRKGKDRTVGLELIRDESRTCVIFAAPSRVARDLADLRVVIGGDRRVVVTRELTKMHEEIWRGTVGEAADEFSDPSRQRGEFTIVIEAASIGDPSIDDAVHAAIRLVAEGASTADAVRDAAAAFGVSRREVYGRVLRSKA